MMNPNSTKVAIPPSKRRQSSSTQARKRISRACDPCRERKRKCYGEQPSCQQCIELELQCEYSDSKRVREQASFARATGKTVVYEELLRDILRGGDEWSRQRIKNALKGSGADLSSQGDIKSAVPSPSPFSPASSSSSSSCGSLDAIDVVSEDLNRSEKSRATGYIGKNSEISWLRGLEESSIKLDEDEEKEKEKEKRQADLPVVRSETSISSLSYHLDDYYLSESKHCGSPFDLPPREIADKLLGAYWNSVNPSFPVVRRTLFSLQVNNLYSNVSADPPGNQWLAILNLVFAIGSKFYQFTEPFIILPLDLRSEVFFSRAKALSVGENVLFEHADLQQTQVEALVAFYFLCSAQINRAWKMVGVAIRSAIALGLNLRNAPRSVHPVSTEVRTRTWLSILYLEHLLNTMTSRVSCLGEGASTVFPPLPFEEELYRLDEVKRLLEDAQYREDHIYWTLHENGEQALKKHEMVQSVGNSPSLYFYHLIDLTMITHSITNTVYNPAVLREGWTQIEERISLYRDKIDAWLRGLEPPLKFIDPEGNLLPDITDRHQLSLALNYFSALMILTRPCLSRFKSNGSEHKEFCQAPHLSSINAALCLQSAEALISILPEKPDAVWLFTVSPWWCVLHFLMQAASILLIHMRISPHRADLDNWKIPIESAAGGVRTDGDVAESSQEEAILAASKKALRWLHSLGERDESSRRAFCICNRLFSRIAPGEAAAHLDDGRESRRQAQQQQSDDGQHSWKASMAPNQKGLRSQYQTDQADTGAGVDVAMTGIPSVSNDPYQTLFPCMTDTSMEWSSIFDIADLSPLDISLI